MYCGGDDIGALVADIGSYSTRIGYAGDDMPRAYLPTSVGVLRNESSEIISRHFDFANFRENMAVENAMVGGVVTNWDHVEKIWEYSLATYLKVNPRETPVLFAEKPYNSPASRQKLCEIMFEKFGSPALFLSKDAVLSCYACGRTSGLVIDCGASGTVVSPVVDGWVEVRGISRSLVGGRYMDAHMLSLMRKRPPIGAAGSSSSSSSSSGGSSGGGAGVRLLPHYRVSRVLVPDRAPLCVIRDLTNVHPTYDAFMSLDLGRDIKESVCRMADSTLVESDPRFNSLPLIPYELPDGTCVDVGIERFQPSELLCEPSLMDFRQPEMLTLGLAPPAGLETSANKSVPRLVLDSVLRCEPDSHASLLSNLVVSGGASCFEGAPERLRNEVEQLVHASAPTWKVKMVAAGAGGSTTGAGAGGLGGGNSERAICAWLGGSIVASLGSFHDMWFTKQEYDEFGPGLVDKKCP